MHYFASLWRINHCRLIFFRVTPVLQWFQLNFGAGNFRGRRPGTSALRILLRLAAVNIEMRMRRVHLIMRTEGIKAFSKRKRRCSVEGGKRYENDKCGRNSF